MNQVTKKLLIGLAAGGALLLAVFYPAGGTKNSLATANNKVPIYFEQNKGQEKDPATKYIAKGADYQVQIGPSGLKIVLPNKHQPGDYNEPINLMYVNANSPGSLEGASVLPGKANYLRTNNPQNWVRDVPLYEKVIQRNIYPNIDLLYYNNSRQIEHDFVIAPGGNPQDITLGFSNVKRLYSNIASDLVFETNTDRLSLSKPTAYQTIDGQKRTVPADYIIAKDLKVKLAVGHYDTTKPLVIDPVLVYSGYLPGIISGQTSSMHVDALGNVYLVGSSGDVNVVKINSAGRIEYSTTFGGVNSDRGFGIGIDLTGNAYIGGVTGSPDFPTVNPYQSELLGEEAAFIVKLDPSGQDLLFSTYLGGNGGDTGKSIAVDSAGMVYIVGTTYSSDFPTTRDAYQNLSAGDSDIFVSKLDPSSSTLVYSTYLGGSSTESGADIYVDTLGNIYVTGSTNSPNFPTSIAAFQSTLSGSEDAFVTKINPAGNLLLYSTYLGGSGFERAESLTVDTEGNAYVTGSSESTNFPLKNALDSQRSGVADAFVSKLAATGSTLIYSTYLGGSARESGLAIATDIAGNTYVTGLTNSTDFPVVEPLQSGLASDFFDAFICKINATGSAFFYSTYLGGSGNEKPLGIFADAAGSLYTIGTTDSTDFPTVTPIAESGSFFIAKIDPALIAQAESATLAKGVSATVAILPSAGNPGISALVTNEDDGVDRSMAVTVSRLLRITHTISLIDMGGNYFDIKAERADSNDRLTVSLYYPNTVVGAAEEVLSLQYYDGIDIEAWQPLRNSGAADPIKDTTDNLDGTLSGGKFSFTLDNTSSPKITNLNLSAIGSDIIDQSVSTIVPEGSTNTVSILPTGDKAGISTTVSNVETFNSLTVRVARFSTNPGTSDVIDIGGGFVDLKIEDADPKDRAVVDLYYPDTVKGATETALGLRYFDSVSWQLLKGSGRADPVKTTTDNLDGTINGGKFRFTLDDTSSIKITELSGTVFTATTVTPTPPPPQPEVTIEALINRVESLEDLKKGDKKQLVNKLKKAQKELAKDKKAEKDKSKKAIKQLEKFIKKVEQLRDKKDFDKVEANTLIEWARIIIADIQ